MAGYKYTREELVKLLKPTVGKTLGEVDVNRIFDKTITHPKITGIAGLVIECSVLGHKADNKQEADLIVNGIPTELKTTGLKHTKKGSEFPLEAKEPMSITAVSPDKIIYEEFYTSKFWEKAENTLFVYYLYDSLKTVTASEYADFPIVGFHFHKFDKHDTEVLENDWSVVRDFILHLKSSEKTPEDYYHLISKLRTKMMYMDTAPKYPNPPRFRFKRSFVSTIVQNYLYSARLEELATEKDFTNYIELDSLLSEITAKYFNWTLEEIANNIQFTLPRDKKGKVSKQIIEQLLVRLFGASSKKIRQIDTFAKIGILPKSIIQTSKGGRTEDMKFDTVDFKEWCNPEIEFEDSVVYEFFANQTILFTIFQEDDKDTPLDKVRFKGFKRYQFDDEFIKEKVRPTWERVRYLVNSGEFKVSLRRNKKGELIITPKTKLPSEETNLPKSKDYDVFLRGTGSDASTKSYELSGYRMYSQQFWLKGSTVIKLLENIDFIPVQY